MCSYTWMVSLFACLTLTLTYLLYFTFLLDPRFTFLRNGATFQLTWSLLENNYKSCTGNVMHHVMYTEQLWWGVYLFDHFNNLRIGIITIVITVIVSGSFILAVRVSRTSNLNNEQCWTMVIQRRCPTLKQLWINVAQRRYNGFSALHNIASTLFQREPSISEGEYYETERGRRARVRASERATESESGSKRERFSIVSKQGINSIRFQSSDKTTIAQVYLHF